MQEKVGLTQSKIYIQMFLFIDPTDRAMFIDWGTVPKRMNLMSTGWLSMHLCLKYEDDDDDEAFADLGRCRSQICRWAIRSLLAMCIIRHSKHFNTLSVIFHILSWSTSRWRGLVMKSNYSIWRGFWWEGKTMTSNRVACNRSSPLIPPHPTLQLSPYSAQPFTVISSDPPPYTCVPNIALTYPPPPYCLAPKPCLKPLLSFTCTRPPLPPSFLFWPFIIIQPRAFYIYFIVYLIFTCTGGAIFPFFSVSLAATLRNTKVGNWTGPSNQLPITEVK